MLVIPSRELGLYVSKIPGPKVLGYRDSYIHYGMVMIENDFILYELADGSPRLEDDVWVGICWLTEDDDPNSTNIWLQNYITVLCD
jgi:hypothetical protein